MNYLKSHLNPKYLIFGGATIFARGLEYIVLLFLASYLTKDIYGQYEFYKKVIELVSVFFSFGIPTLLLTYPKTKDSKISFSFFGIGIVFLCSIITFPVFFYLDLHFLLVPILFFSIFLYSGSIVQLFNLVFYGSTYSAKYKIIVSIIFSFIIVLFAYIFKYNQLSLVKTTYFLFPAFLLIYIIKYYQLLSMILFKNIKRYFKIFLKLLLSSFTLVLSTFLTFSFLYVDIFVIKLLAEYPNELIADYAFSLNIANVLVIIPLTITQVDIELVKKRHRLIFGTIKKTIKYVALSSLFVWFIYFVLITTIFSSYSSTLLLFSIILFAKIIQAFTVPYGFFMLINKLYKQNLYINIFVLALNIILSYILFNLFGSLGIAFASLICIFVRFLLIKFRLRTVFNKLQS